MLHSTVEGIRMRVRRDHVPAGWALLAFLAACSPAAFYPSQPNTAHQLAALRTQDGACAHAWLDSTHIQACARTGAPFTTADSDVPVLLTRLSAPTFGDADPSSWLIIVTGPDGKELTRQSHEKIVPEVGSCSEYGCNKWSTSLLLMPAAWKAGTYRLRYVCTFDTRRIVDFSINLSGS